LGKIEEAKSELTNVGDNPFTDDTVMAEVLNYLLACYKTFSHLGRMFMFLMLSKPSAAWWGD